jgi:hypothetical protein
MAEPAVLKAIAELGQAYRRLGWYNRLASLREFYAVVAAGGGSTPAWTPVHLERMRSIMGLGPNPLPVASQCPTCPPPATRRLERHPHRPPPRGPLDLLLLELRQRVGRHG